MAEWSEADIRRVFELQQKSKWKAKASTVEERKEKLNRLRAAVLERAEAIDEALHADLRRSRQQFPDGFTGAGTETFGVIGEIDLTLAGLDEWVKPQEVPASFPGTAPFIQYEARGQVLVYGPWNYPFLLTVQPLVPLIAAGNVAIVKPNELTPATSAVIADLIRETFAEDEVAVFEGGVDLSNALSELPVDHVFFTGSPAVGKIVMAAAAKHLASVTLELGGKCPVVIDETANLDAAAQALAVGKLSNAGQICLAPDHAFVKNEVRDAFVEKFLDAVRARVYDGEEIDTEVFASIVNEANFDRVAGYIDDATARGARVLGTGGRNREERTIEPAVLLDVPKDASVMQDEIFGPILPVFGYDDLEDVVEDIRTRTKPLTMYAFTDSEDVVNTLQSETSTGGLSINGWASNFLEFNLPFGGVNHSGSGSYHGIHGFRELSHARAVVRIPAQA